MSPRLSDDAATKLFEDEKHAIETGAREPSERSMVLMMFSVAERMTAVYDRIATALERLAGKRAPSKPRRRRRRKVAKK